MAPARVLLPINNIKGDPVNIAIKEYKRVKEDFYNLAAYTQKRHQSKQYNFKYYLDAMVIIDGDLYLMDESERRN